MDVLFKSTEEQAFFQSEKQLIKEYGKEMAKKITQRLNEIQAFDSVGQWLACGLGKPEILKANRKNQISVHLNKNYRLIVEIIYSEHIDISSVNFFEITIVRLEEVVDYHG